MKSSPFQERRKKMSEDKKIDPSDDGELMLELLYAPESNSVVLKFHTSVKWIGLTPEQAIEIGENLAKIGREYLKPDEEGGSGNEESPPAQVD